MLDNQGDGHGEKRHLGPRQLKHAHGRSERTECEPVHDTDQDHPYKEQQLQPDGCPTRGLQRFWACRRKHIGIKTGLIPLCKLLPVAFRKGSGFVFEKCRCLHWILHSEVARDNELHRPGHRLVRAWQ